MHPKRKDLAFFGALSLCVGLAAAFTVQRGHQSVPFRSAESATGYNASSWHPDASGDAPVPTRENVSPGYHREVAALEQQVNEDPTDTVAVARLAQLFESSHQFEQAARYYRRLLTLHRGSREAWIGLARVYADLENWEAAEGAIASLLELAPGDPEAMYNLGAIHANRGDYSAARTWWRKVERQGRDPQLAKRAAESLERIAGSTS
jgi:cytochrome c-type biogenesis protein CcmH